MGLACNGRFCGWTYIFLGRISTNRKGVSSPVSCLYQSKTFLQVPPDMFWTLSWINLDAFLPTFRRYVLCLLVFGTAPGPTDQGENWNTDCLCPLLDVFDVILDLLRSVFNECVSMQDSVARLIVYLFDYFGTITQLQMRLAVSHSERLYIADIVFSMHFKWISGQCSGM